LTVLRFQAFSIFTGLGIHNCQMYENACQLMAKQSVALEVLSFHAMAPAEEAQSLVVSDAQKHGAQKHGAQKKTWFFLCSFLHHDFLRMVVKCFYCLTSAVPILQR
jgi:hypothetical protein